MNDEEINSILENGIKNHQENKLDEAIISYVKVIEEDNGNLKANLLLGIIFAQQQDALQTTLIALISQL